MLSYIFVLMIVISVVFAIFCGNTSELSASIMSGGQSAIELVISLCAMMCLWSGVMEVAKESKLTDKLALGFAPILKKLFKDVKKDSKAFSYICMNVSANLLGLANAATPFGLKAMKELSKDSKSDIATDSMITFVVMNTASIQLFPTTIAAMRSSLGSKSPFDIIFCVWIVSALALSVGLVVSKLCCKFWRNRCNL